MRCDCCGKEVSKHKIKKYARKDLIVKRKTVGEYALNPKHRGLVKEDKGRKFRLCYDCRIVE